MRFDIMTLFPDMVMGVLGESIIGRAQRAGHIEIHAHNIRDYSLDKHRKTDDTPFGGGVGMVMTCQPIYDCYKAIEKTLPEGGRTRVIYMSPKGRLFSHEVAKELGVSPVQLVYAYLIESSPSIIPIAASSTKEQFCEVLDSLKITLSQEFMEILG